MPDTLLLAFAEIVKALALLLEKVTDGQTPEQKKIMWDWFIKDVQWWRVKLGIDKEPS